jgi:TolA-binding protein
LAAGQAAEFFRPADTLFKEEQYPEAIEAYLDALTKLPEAAPAPQALGNLARAYVLTEDLVMARAVSGYLAERFAGREDAARAALLLASFLRRNDQVPMAIDTYRRIGIHFPEHEKAPAALHTVALSDLRDGRRAEALATLGEVVARYPKSEFYLDALTVLGTEYRKAGEHEKALEAWSTLAEATPESRRKAAARMFEADALSRLGRPAEAVAIYASLVKALDPSLPGNPYYDEAEDRDEVITLWEQADLQVGYSLAHLQEDADTNREKAIRVYAGFPERHPESERIPKAMAGQGGVLLALDRVDEAAAVFEQLARDYPQTPEGRNSLFTLASTAIEVGNVEVARDAVRRMADDADAYGADMLAAVGQIMLTNNLYDEARAVFEHVREHSDDPTLQEYALFGLGKSHFQQGAYPEAIEALDALLALNSRTALFYQAKFLLGRAHRELGEHDAAIAALTDVFKFTRDPTMKRQADLELALIQEQQGRKDAAFASYLRIALHPDPTGDPAVAALVERAMARAIALGMEQEAYGDVLLLCDRFLKFFDESEYLDQVRQARRDAGLEQARRGVVTP